MGIKDAVAVLRRKGFTISRQSPNFYRLDTDVRDARTVIQIAMMTLQNGRRRA